MAFGGARSQKAKSTGRSGSRKTESWHRRLGAKDVYESTTTVAPKVARASWSRPVRAWGFLWHPHLSAKSRLATSSEHGAEDERYRSSLDVSYFVTSA